MRRKASRTGSLVTLLATLALLFITFAAQADDESTDRHRRVHKIVIGDHHGDHGDPHEYRGLMGGKGGYLGVTLTELTPELRAHFGVPEDVGVMISQVMEDSPAQRAGVKVGDIISGVDGEDVGSAMSLKKRISPREDGEAAMLEVWRDGQMETLTATLEAREGMRFRRMEFLGDGRLHLGCGDSEDCEVEVTCDDGDCNCIVNGEESDCAALHLNKLHNKHHE